MTTDLMAPHATPPQSSSPAKPARRKSEPTVEQIIAAARAKPPKAAARGAWLLGGATGLLFYASFTPLDWSPLAWVALLPILLLVRLPRPTRWMYTALYGTALATMIAQLQWLRLGDQTMYLAWIALSIYLACYFPLFVGLCRVAVHRLGVPLMLAAPVVWTATELSRAHVMTGFAWYYLGHTQYRWLELIQISDITGAYGVSFLIVMVSACLAGLVPGRVFARLRLLPKGCETASGPKGAIPDGSLRRQSVAVAVSLTVFAAVISYGVLRRNQADFKEGPRIALVQGNFTSDVKFDPAKQQRIFYKHLSLTELAARHQPDLIVWPETSYPNRLWNVTPGVTDEQLRQWTPRIDPQHWRRNEAAIQLSELGEIYGTALLLGLNAIEARPDGLHPYNSVAFVRAKEGFVGRYDKIHRVIFGEYMPLRRLFPWLYKLTPYPEDFGIDAGTQAVAFTDRGWRYLPLICYEDTVPHLTRNMVRATRDAQGRPADVLVNVTNDGWFHGSSELNQHLLTAVFRAVECRTPMVRAVNTGISAVIDGDGLIVEPDTFMDADSRGRTTMRDPQTGRLYKSLNAVLVDDVPLDNRRSLYVAWGDWFALTCAMLTAVIALIGLLPRRPRADGGLDQFAREAAALSAATPSA